MERIFHKVGATEEKACLLGPASKRLLQTGSKARYLPDVMGQVDVIGEKRFFK